MLKCTLNVGGPANSAADAPTCTIPPTAVAMGGTAIATVATKASSTTASLAIPAIRGKGTGWAGGGAVLALLVFLGIPARRRSWRAMLGVLVLMLALGSLAACGGSGGGGGGGGGGTTDPGTASGLYTFTVTGTGNPAVAIKPADNLHGDRELEKEQHQRCGSSFGKGRCAFGASLLRSPGRDMRARRTLPR